MHSSALVDGVFFVARLQQPNHIGSVVAHIAIGFTGQRHRHSGVVRLTGHRQDSVLPVVLGGRQFSSACAELLCSKDDRVLHDRLQNLCASRRHACAPSRHYARQFSFARVFDSGDGLIFDFGADSSYGFGSGYQGEPD